MHEEITHPCVQHKLALIRDSDTGHKEFRELATEITMFVCYEALKNVRVREIEVQTPVATAQCNKIDEDIVVVPILRAGVGMLDGILALIPSARVGFVGLYRDEETKEPVSYYESMPHQVKKGLALSSIRCWRLADLPSLQSMSSNHRERIVSLSSALLLVRKEFSESRMLILM